MNKVEFYCDANLTPVQCPNAWNPGSTNPDGTPAPVSFQPTDRPVYVQHHPWHDWMVANGFREAFGIYDGTIGRSNWWRGVSLSDYNSGKRGILPAISSADPNVDMGQLRDTVQACVKLGDNPKLYGGSSVFRMPIWFDLENPRTAISLWTTEEIREANLAYQVQILSWAREVYSGRLMWYAGNPPFNIDAQLTDANRQIVDAWDAGKFDPVIEITEEAAVCIYPDNEVALDPESFDRRLDDMVYRLDRRYPNVRRTIWLSFQWLIMWAAKMAEVNKIEVPSQLRHQLQYATDRGFNVFIWYDPLNPIVKFDLTNKQIVGCLLVCKEFMADPTPLSGASAFDMATLPPQT